MITLKGAALAVPCSMVGLAAESAYVGPTAFVAGVGKAVPLVTDGFVTGGNPLTLLVLDQEGFVIVAIPGAVGAVSTEKAKDSTVIGGDFVVSSGAFGWGGSIAVSSPKQKLGLNALEDSRLPLARKFPQIFKEATQANVIRNVDRPGRGVLCRWVIPDAFVMYPE